MQQPSTPQLQHSLRSLLEQLAIWKVISTPEELVGTHQSMDRTSALHPKQQQQIGKFSCWHVVTPSLRVSMCVSRWFQNNPRIILLIHWRYMHISTISALFLWFVNVFCRCRTFQNVLERCGTLRTLQTVLERSRTL